MKSRLRQLLRSALGPALRWFSAQLGELQRGVDALRDGQDTLRGGQEELLRLQRSVGDQRDGEIEVIGRTLAAQRDALESLGAEQRRLVEEVRALRAELGAGQVDAPRS